MIPDTYLNLKYNNCKRPFLFLFLFSENTNSETITNGPLVSKKSINNRTEDYEGKVRLKTTFQNPILVVAFTSILI